MLRSCWERFLFECAGRDKTDLALKALEKLVPTSAVSPEQFSKFVGKLAEAICLKE